MNIIKDIMFWLVSIFIIFIKSESKLLFWYEAESPEINEFDFQNDDFNDFPDITDNQKVYDFSIKMLENIIKQLSAKNKKTDNIVVDKLIQFINDNFSKNISLQDAAESVFFNPAYCSRFFKEQTGENFSNYLLKVRMEHAVKLLKDNKKINDISKECGYQSPGYFTRVFKDYYNCTPSEYLHNS